MLSYLYGFLNIGVYFITYLMLLLDIHKFFALVVTCNSVEQELEPKFHANVNDFRGWSLNNDHQLVGC